MFKYRNPNPCKEIVGDCVIRALSILLGQSWDDIYDDLSFKAKMMCDMPSSNEVWSEYMYERGFTRRVIPDTCPACYTINRFCQDNPRGEFLLATGSHVVAVIDGDYYDTWDSGQEVPIYYFKRRN